jgi:hypothetical protein
MPLKRLNNKVRITSLVLAILGSALFGYALLNGSLTSRKRPSKAETATLNIATGLSTQVNLSFRAADLLIQEIAELEGNRSLRRLNCSVCCKTCSPARAGSSRSSTACWSSMTRAASCTAGPAGTTGLPGMEPAAAMARMQAGPEGRSSGLLIGTPSSAA